MPSARSASTALRRFSCKSASHALEQARYRSVLAITGLICNRLSLFGHRYNPSGTPVNQASIAHLQSIVAFRPQVQPFRHPGKPGIYAAEFEHACGVIAKLEADNLLIGKPFALEYFHLCGAQTDGDTPITLTRLGKVGHRRIKAEEGALKWRNRGDPGVQRFPLRRARERDDQQVVATTDPLLGASPGGYMDMAEIPRTGNGGQCHIADHAVTTLKADKGQRRRVRHMQLQRFLCCCA